MTEESKINATDRLRREGRWDEASRFRDEVKQQLRAEGKSRQEANDAAWAAMLAKYQPLAPSDGTGEFDDVWIEDTDASHDEANRPNLVADIMWTYLHLAIRSTQPKDAPNPGAWSMLCWARRHVNRFFEQLFPKVLSASSQQTRNLHVQHARPDDDEDEGLRRLEAIFEETRLENENCRKEAEGRQSCAHADCGCPRWQADGSTS